MLRPIRNRPALRSFRVLSLTLLSLLAAATTHAGETASCEGKRTWQRSIVEGVIRSWFDQSTHSEGLLELIQAEQGIAACRQGDLIRLHTTRLPINLVPSQLGAVLLANELEWRGLVPSPEEALAGKFFRVARTPAVAAPAAPSERRPAPAAPEL